MATKNFFIAPEDGWVQVTDTTSRGYTRMSAFPHTHAFYVYGNGSTTPILVSTGSIVLVTFDTGISTADQTITIADTEVYTFKVARANPFEVTIGLTNLADAANFAFAVNTDSTFVNAQDNGDGTVLLTTLVAGDDSNYDIATDADNVDVGDGVFTGGSSADMGVLVCHHPFEIINGLSGDTDQMWIRTPTASNQGGKLRIDVYINPGAFA